MTLLPLPSIQTLLLWVPLFFSKFWCKITKKEAISFELGHFYNFGQLDSRQEGLWLCGCARAMTSGVLQINVPTMSEVLPTGRIDCGRRCTLDVSESL